MNDRYVAQPHDNDTGKSDTFQRRLGREPPPPASPPEDSGPKVYVPYALALEGREEEGLTFYHADGLITVKFYMQLGDLICPYPYEYLSLIYMDCVYTLKGRNLEELIPLIKRHKLDTMQCFDRTVYAVPIKGVVIYSIMRESHEEIKQQLRGSERAHSRD